MDEAEARASPQGRPVVAALSRRGPGLARWSVELHDIEATATRVGLPVEQRLRARPDGHTVRWRAVGVDAAWDDPWRCAFMAWDDPDTHPARRRRRPRQRCHRLRPTRARRARRGVTVELAGRGPARGRQRVRQGGRRAHRPRPDVTVGRDSRRVTPRRPTPVWVADTVTRIEAAPPSVYGPRCARARRPRCWRAPARPGRRATTDKTGTVASRHGVDLAGEEVPQPAPDGDPERARPPRPR